MSTVATPRSLNPDVEDGLRCVYLDTVTGGTGADAQVLRPLCVHGGWGPAQGREVVSHLATGRQVRAFPTRKAAVEFARELRGRLLAGGFNDSADPEEVVRRIHAIVPPDELKDLFERHGGLR